MLDPGWVVRLLRVGYTVAAVAHLLDIVQAQYFSFQGVRGVILIDVANVAGWSLALVYTLRPGFARHWKPLTLALCMLMVAGWTFGATEHGLQSVLFISMIVLLMATSVLAIWETRWQVTLTVYCLIAAAINTALVPTRDDYIGILWLNLLDAAAIVIAGSRLWARFAASLAKAWMRLSDSEAQLRKVIDANADAVSVVRVADGRYLYVNEGFLTRGYRREEVLGKSVDEVGRVDPRAVEELFSRARAEGFVRNQEMNIRMADGRTVPHLVSSVLIDMKGEECLLSVAREITEVKEVQNELIAAREAALSASRAKSEFLSSMSHEIRTPMNAILGMADLLAETSLSNEQRRYVETMVNNGNALLDLINSILNLAKVESGRLHLEQTDFDLIDLMEMVTETFAARAHEKGLELLFHILPDVPTGLVGDPLRLRQILVNLLSNAIKFTEHGEVVLTVEKDGAASGEGVALRFSVSDTGIGIQPDQLETIFQTFTQADSSITRKFGGSGLGLAIARRLAELMHGRIWVESEPGRGSAFYFTASFGVADSPRFTAQPLDLTGVRTLVVDDNATSRLILREILDSRGAEIQEVAGAERALAEIERASKTGERFGLVLLDCEMPAIDGFQLAEQLKRNPAGDQAIVLMLTSDDMSHKLMRVREIGVDACVVKPIRRAELFRVIASAMGRAKTPQPMPSGQPAAAGAVSARSLRILLAEDSPDNRRLIEAYLKDCPYTVDVAENGAVAFEKFVRNSYDVVLMDVQMPVMDGLSATRRIRQWEREQRLDPTPIIALTAHALEENMRQSLEAGCTAHVNKPVKKTALLAAIEELAQRPAPSGHPDATRAVNGARPATGATPGRDLA